MDWLKDNYQWIFSGIGIFVIGLILAIFKTKKSQPKQTTASKTQNQINNDVKAKQVFINQTIISESKTGKINSNIEDKASDLELEKIKEEYFGPKNEIRTYLIKKLVEARHNNTVLQVRHITDLGEFELGLQHDNTVHELEKIEEEGLIKFELSNNEMISPYTRIKLTEKYFEKQ